MRCRTARHWMDLQVDGELEESRLPLLARHLERCPRCAAEHRRLAQQEALLRSVLPRPDPTQVEIERGVARLAGILGPADEIAPPPRLRRVRWGWAVATVLACLLIVALAWGPHWVERPQLIADAGGGVLSRDRDWIAYIQADGLYVRQLSEKMPRRVAAGRCANPTWAPDATRIAFVRREGRSQRLVMAEIAGGSERLLLAAAPGELLEDPQWAPQGNKILFVRDRKQPHSAELLLVDAESGVSRKVDDVAPSRQRRQRLQRWAPDARHFAFVRWRPKREAEYAIGQPQGRTLPLASLARGIAPQIAWSQDGRHLVYAGKSKQPGHGALWLAELHQPLRSISHPGGHPDPTWSPNGERLCYVQTHTILVDQVREKGPGLRTVEMEGEPMVLTTTSGDNSDRRPVWSPDGQRIAYERVSPNGRSRVYVVSANGGEPTPLGNDDENQRLIGWDASGTRLLVERLEQPGSGPARHSTWLEKVS